MGEITGATLLINARVQMTPEKLEADVRTAVFVIATQLDLGAEILELASRQPGLSQSTVFDEIVLII